MKSTILLLGLLAIIPGFHSLRGDTLDTDKISITGSIILETNTNGATLVKPITIANVLSVLGISGEAKTMRYYYDEAGEGSYVIASKSLTSGTGTPVATICSFGESYAGWSPNNHSVIDAGSTTGLNDDLTGTSILEGVHPGRIETDVTKFTLYGMVSGMQAIMKGTIVDIYKLSN